ncbi:MAG: hypothetical protein MUO94_04790 [Thermoplasmata archaeon]|nr:hypothetical protein [Thermoplasmata archaeon]
MLFLIVLAPVNEILNGIFGMTAVAFALFSWYLIRRVRSIENRSAGTG